jgi:tight adherence protein B
VTFVRRALVGALVVGLSSLAWSAPAAAQPTGRVSEVSATDGSLLFVLSAESLSPGVGIDPESVTVSIDGTEVEAFPEPIGEASADIANVAVLTIDVSGSMAADGRMEGAKQAATRFLESAPNNLEVGLVTFSEDVQVLVSPTPNRAEVQAAVDGLEPLEGTALYDGVLAAVREAGPEGARILLLLSDGADTRSDATVGEAEAAVAEAGVLLDAVALGPESDEASDALDRMAAAGSGRVLSAETSGAELQEAFAEILTTIASQVLVTAELPPGEAGQTLPVQVRAEAGGEEFSTDFAITLGSDTVPQVGPVPITPSGGALPQAWLLAALAAVFVGLAVLVRVALATTTAGQSAQNRFLRRMSFYTISGRGPRRQETVTVLGTSAVARTAVEFAGRVAERPSVESALLRRLDAAGVPIRPAEWIVVHAGIAMGSGLLLFLLTGASWVALVIGLLLGSLLPFAYLIVKESRRKAAFATQLPDTLQLVAGSLAAGYSMPQAIDTVVREGEQPISAELNKTLVETRLGVPLEDALDSVAERMQSQDFAWVVMAVRIQREVGGNLAEVLRTVAETLRERDYLRRQVRSLSAEGRFSALILGLLPPLFALYLLVVRPEYLQLLYTDVLGIAMIVVALVLLAAGILWMRKIVNIEV